MSTPTANLGVTKKVTIYVEDSNLGRDFVNMTSFSWEPKYVEGDDEYLGESEEEPWQRATGASGAFDIDERDADYCNRLEQALRDAERTGQKPKVRIVERTLSNSGTTSKMTFSNAVLKVKVATGGKNEKIKRSYTWRSSAPKLG